MRQEDKEVDGPEIEQAEEKKRESELVEEKDDELHDLDGLPETSHDKDQSQAVIGAMRTILAGEQIVINDLKLPKRQLVALESLKAAVDGKDTRLSRFVYAEDRRTLLEQALAVLQPEISGMQGGSDEFKDMLDKVGSLRERLNVLEDAEEEIIEGSASEVGKDGNDTDDKDDDADDDVVKAGDATTTPKKKKGKGKGKGRGEDQDLSLDGPERPLPPKGPTTLEGKAVEAAPKGPTTLEGPALKATPKPASALDGPALKDEPKGPTTLEGPAVKDEPKGPTTLGDPKELDAIATENAPRWRRPGG